MIDIPEEKPLDDKTDGADAERAENQSQPEISPQIFQNRKTKIGPQHVETAVGEIQDPQDPEDQGQSAGHQPDEHAGGQAG